MAVLFSHFLGLFYDISDELEEGARRRPLQPAPLKDELVQTEG